MNPAPETPVGTTMHRLRWPLVVITLGLLLLLGFLAFLWFSQRTYEGTLERGGDAGRYVFQQAGTIAHKFLSGNITTTFLAAIPRISGTGAGHLELATAEQVETFRAEDEKSIFWDTLYLGKTVSEIRVPVTYRYHLRLADPWQIEVSGQTCIVSAPAIRPSLPPGIHTGRMEKKSEAGWARFNAAEQMASLEKGMTPTLEQYAGDSEHLAAVREESRKTVAEFIRTWLLRENHWRADRFRTIKVIFADEPAADPQMVAPTVELQ